MTTEVVRERHQLSGGIVRKLKTDGDHESQPFTERKSNGHEYNDHMTVHELVLVSFEQN